MKQLILYGLVFGLPSVLLGAEVPTEEWQREAFLEGFNVGLIFCTPVIAARLVLYIAKRARWGDNGA